MVQYLGVAASIDNDIFNQLAFISGLVFLPLGLFIKNVAKHMAVELGQECDYVREAECSERMRAELATYTEYRVPVVISDLSSKQVLTTGVHQRSHHR